MTSRLNRTALRQWRAAVWASLLDVVDVVVA